MTSRSPYCRRILASSGLVLLILAGCGEDPYASLTADQLLNQGIERTDRVDFIKAEPLFAAAAAKAEPGSDTWRQATYAQAVCNHQMTPASASQIKQATTLYASLVEGPGHSVEAGNAALQLARVAGQSDYFGDPIDTVTAREWYNKAITGWANQDVAGEAVLGLAGTYFATLEKADAELGAKHIEEWLAAHPNDRLAAVMWQHIADAYHMILDDTPRALRALRKAEDLGFVNNGRKHIPLWTMARLAEKSGDRELAIRAYRRLVEDFPTAGKGWEAQERLRGLGVEPPELKRFAKTAAPASTVPGAKP